ncbi:SGNH/GDSL hydrolase family protein [Herbaspirillum sp. GCM10030257]|uniref:SGNH/GDSL hydrolase family protein n=1 Tax=Herbaspirillum sp. GCM10030257 TaxID=3273393 RepID=UPI00361802BB
MRHYFPELVALPMLPFLILQGKRTRRLTPRLPEAAGPAHGRAGAQLGGPPLRLLGVGESPIAGVGVTTYDEAITCQFAAALSARLSRPVAWRACGKNGVTAAEALEQVVPIIPVARVDIALIAFGVNDTTAFQPAARWRHDLSAILSAIAQRCSPTLTIVSGVPPMAHFPALPQPLRHVMGLKAQTLDAVARTLVAQHPRTLHIPLAIDVRDRTLMASDGYHASAAGCTAWANLLAQATYSHMV